MTELALSSYAGFYTTTPPTDASAYGVYWPLLVPRDEVRHVVVLPDGTRLEVPHARVASTPIDPPARCRRGPRTSGRRRAGRSARCAARAPATREATRTSGLWTRSDDAYHWLAATLTVDVFRSLVTEAEALDVLRYELANLRALNFVVVGLLGDGVASSTRYDPQAKGLGEYLRSRFIDVPDALVAP